VHPNDAGFQKMADRWYPALASLLGPPSTASPPPPSGACTATYQVVSQWAGGFQDQATVTARNASWNGVLAPGASTSFGFLASWTGTNPVPAVGYAVT
jgi:hypothetical protein